MMQSVPPALQQASSTDSWTLMGRSGSVSCGVTAPFSCIQYTQGFVCALQGSVSLVLCKFWCLNGGFNGDLLQEGLCHTQVYCTQSPCPCSSPLLTRTSTGDTQTQFCLSLCGISGSWCTQGLFESCGHLCQFDSKHEFMPPTIFLGLLLCPWMWGISSQPLQHSTATAPDSQRFS